MDRNAAENAACCERCGHPWDWGTTWLGELVPVHSVNRCIPRPVPVYQEEDEESDIPQRVCEECRGKFRPRKSNHNAKLCGSECRVARRDRKKKESDSKRGKFWKLEVMAQLNLPTKPCAECGSLFTVSGKFSNKQILCSLKCKKARESRKSKERAA